MAKMIKHLYDSGAPLNLLDGLTSIINEATLSGDFVPGKIPTYDPTINKMKKLFSCPGARKESIMVSTGIMNKDKTSDEVMVTFPVFDFFEQMQSLLDLLVLEDISNLVVNPDDPFTKYKTRRYCKNPEIMDSEFFQNALRYSP